MKNYTQQLDLNTSITLPDGIAPTDVIFFDIETTGFAPANTTLYLIGCIYYKDSSYYMTQWFADSADSEKDLLTAFISFLDNYKTLIHYNGSGFDIPYIIKKCHIYGIKCDFSHLNSLDIYKEIQPVKNLLKIENLKQKTIEKFLNIDRDDTYSGGELIKIYQDYLHTPTDEALNLLLLHNHDDIIGMTSIMPVLKYRSIANGEYTFKSIELNTIPTSALGTRKEVVITLTLNNPVPTRISYGKDFFYLTAFKDVLKLCIEVYTDELKFFYPNYKDYYYLPEEDCALHKSVAFYVDKNFRTKAKAANCYSKKTGTFLPQTEEIVTPYFKIDYHDKTTYFEFTEDFNSNDELIMDYARYVVRYLIK